MLDAVQTKNLHSYEIIAWASAFLRYPHPSGRGWFLEFLIYHDIRVARDDDPVAHT